MLSCNQCGYEWKPRPASAGNPTCCPKCKRYDWDEPSKKLSRGGERANTAPARKRSEVAPQITPPSDAMLRVQVPPPATSDDEELAEKLCKACEGALMIAKGFWVCGDQSCGLYGKQQGRV